MNLKKIALSLLIVASSLFAIASIEPVTNLSVSAPHNTGTTTNDASIDFTWTPPANVAKYYYKLDTNGTNYDLVSEGGYETLNSTGSSLNVTATASGSYYLHLVAVDSGDATSSPALVQVTSAIDIDAGTVTMSPDGGAITTDTNSITLSGTESGTIYYTVDGTTPDSNSSVYSTPLVLGVGATIKAMHIDDVGNEGAVVSKTFTITNNPSILRANDDVAVNGTTISTSTTNALKISGTDLTRYKYKKSTDASWTTVASIATTIDISGLASGTHTYDIVGGDAYNFQADDAATTVTFTVDNTAPSGLAILVNDVEADEANSTTVTFADNFTFTMTNNDVNNSTIYYTTDGSNPTNLSSVYAAPVTTTETVASSSTAQVTVKMIAYDDLDNASAIKSVTFTIDKEAPSIVMPAAQIYSSVITVSFSSDDVNALLYYQVTASDVSPQTDDMSVLWQVGTSADIGSPTLATDRFLHVVAIDEVANKSAVSTQTFTYQSSGTSILSANASLDFGLVDVDSPQSSSLTITNSGTDSITISDTNITVTGSDFNISSTTCTTSALSSGATCNIVLSFTPSLRGTTTSTLSIAYDGTNSSELNTTLSGSSLGTAPTITTTTITTAEDTNVSGSIAATDVDSDPLTFSVTSDVSNGALTMDPSGSYTYAPTSGHSGADAFTIVANDGDFNSTAQVVAITITEAVVPEVPADNSPVVADIASIRLQTAQATNIAVIASDADSDTITYSVSSSDTSVATASINASGIISIATLAEGASVITVTVTANDDDVTTTFTVTVVDTEVALDLEPADTTFNSDNTQFTYYVDNGGTLDIFEKDDGTIATTLLSSNNTVDVVVNYIGASVSVDANATVRTSFTAGTASVIVSIDTAGKSTSSVEIGTFKTEVEISVIDSNTTVDSTGNIKTEFTMQSKAVSLDVSAANGTMIPFIPQVVMPSELPAGTVARVVDDSTITFGFIMPATLTFN